MTCKQFTSMTQGKLSEAAWQQHAKSCPACQETMHLQEALSAALAAPAAPAELVEQVFAKTTRRKSFFVRWRMALASGLAAVLVVAGAVYYTLQPQPFDNAELVAYMYQNETNDYGTFLSDLETLEQEF